MTRADAFFSVGFVVDGDGCWLWAGGVSGNGYGAFYHDGLTTLAHREAWEIENGPIPSGLEILHSCDRPLCVRPDHLMPGTHRQNMADSVTRGRSRSSIITHCAQGHEFTPENTVYAKNGKYMQRKCRTCKLARDAAYRERMRRGACS